VGDIIRLDPGGGLNYTHVVCECGCNTFHVEWNLDSETRDLIIFHCPSCDNVFPLRLTIGLIIGEEED